MWACHLLASIHLTFMRTTIPIVQSAHMLRYCHSVEVWTCLLLVSIHLMSIKTPILIMQFANPILIVQFPQKLRYCNVILYANFLCASPPARYSWDPYSSCAVQPHPDILSYSRVHPVWMGIPCLDGIVPSLKGLIRPKEEPLTEEQRWVLQWHAAMHVLESLQYSSSNAGECM